MEALKAPFPAFGGKSRIATLVWERFGRVANYVEPFAFSAAMLLGRPEPHSGSETINDLNGYVANFWRAVQRDPEGVAEYADSPVFENDLHAWHIWLVARKEELVSRLEGDPDYYDAKIAGKWCWGMCCWIGSGFCEGAGPWQSVDGRLVHLGDTGQGVKRQRVHLGDAGRGVNRKRVHLGDTGQGVKRQLGVGVHEWMLQLAERLQRVRVCCGDWSRVCGPTPTFVQGLTAVFLDPPYSSAGRDAVYGHTEDFTMGVKVADWCRDNQDNPLMRLALCGYEGEHDLPGWDCVAWKAHGGYGKQAKNGNDNNLRERIWFSPHCRQSSRASQLNLF